MNKKSKNELHVAFSLGSIIDTKKAEEVLDKEGVKSFHNILQKYAKKNTIFKPGPSLGLFMALRKLNQNTPDSVLKIKFALITKIDPNPNVSSVIMDSMIHYLEENKETPTDWGFDVVMMTNGKDTTFCHKVFQTDLMFTTDKNNAKTLFKNNFPVVCIENISQENNWELYEKRKGSIVLFSDYDGVIGDEKSEEVFQEAIKNNEKALDKFLEYENQNRTEAMELGPLGNVAQKLGRVIKYQKQQQIQKGISLDLFNTVIVTARGGQAKNRLMITLKKNNIEISELYMLQGQNKNDLLKELGFLYQGHNLLFFDDSEIHFARSQKLSEITSGWVPNLQNTK